MSGHYDLWHRFVYRFILGVYFARVTVTHRNRLPRRGPALYLALHRNGAVDGFVYHRALGGPAFMISTQLRKNWFARLFFAGIAVARMKDGGERGGNEAALKQCLEGLRAGGQLCVFPEGTSSLGPRHLPFKSGAAWLIMDYLGTHGPPLQVVPVGIHYECPWAFRAKVEVAVGEPIALGLPEGLSAGEKLKTLKLRIQAGLEEVGLNVPSAADQARIERLAYAATLATPRSYFDSLKALERGIPEPLRTAEENLAPKLSEAKLLFHQGVPLFPLGPVGLYALALALLAPVVLGAIALNLPPLLAGWAAGQKLPDGRNVVSLWRILAGVPAFWIWMASVAVVCLLLGRPLWLLGYAGLTWAGLHLYYRVKKLAVAVHNGARYPALKPAMLEFRETLLRNLPAENANSGAH
jgi:1-acyl-sn-glycerol-3-phosphate acyltransferase